MENGLSSPASDSASTVVAGVQSGTVVDNKDPDKMGRVKVSFHWDADNNSSSWARVSMPIAGNQYGVYMLPEVGDEVLIAFANNNHDHPVVIGTFYNGDNKQTDCYDDDNYIKNIKTKSGNEIRFTDKPGEEEVLIISKTNTDNQIILTLKDNGKITIQSKGKIELTAPEIDLNANKTFAIKGGEVNISGTKVTIKSDGDMDLTALKLKADSNTGINLSSSAGDVSISGLNIQASAQIGATIKGNATAELLASGQTVVKGAIVMIN